MILPYEQGQEALRLLAAKQMGKFLDGLPRETAEPEAPANLQKLILGDVTVNDLKIEGRR